ncbi:MAG: hypothetical protein JWN02_2622 [Acidobacteria bacterium]|nr:hypothetical protein [Acidobacteriota bacterium]
MHRVAAIVRADFLVRFRRLSTVVLFLLLSATAYLWVPPVSSGRTLMEINGQRALYNSAAIGIGTAMLGTIFIGLGGFYVISNAVKRDALSRCGFVMASTTMRSSEYLWGKLLGNILFLTTFMTGFMLTAMAMLLVRGEAPLEPWIFVKQYLLLVPPTIVFVAVLGIVFESIPWLSGRVGDVLYFFLWATTLGLVANAMEHGAPHWVACFDFTGLGFLMAAMKGTVHTTQISIGASDFDARKGIYVLHGLILDRSWILPRLASLVSPLLLMPVAQLFFHRFDPARLRSAHAKGRRTWLMRLNGLAKPLSRGLTSFATRLGSGNSIVGAALADAAVTMSTMPLLLLFAIGIAIASLVSGSSSLRTGVIPAAFVLVAVAIAEVSCRERRHGAMSLVLAAPGIKQRFVLWKLLSTAITAALFLAAPTIRLALIAPRALPGFLIGSAFVCAAAAALGIISSNPKTFIVLFLSFWYVAVNDHGHTPNLDFASLAGVATPSVMALYGTLALLLTIAAEAMYRNRLRREY